MQRYTARRGKCSMHGDNELIGDYHAFQIAPFPHFPPQGSEKSGPFSFYDFIAYINVITQWFTKLVRLPEALPKYRIVFIMR